jgi:hypothetical protein
VTHIILLPLWELIALVAGVSVASSIPSAYFAARRGAANAIRACSQHNDCALVKDAVRQGWTEQLVRQHAELLREHPDVLARRRAAEDEERNAHQ